MGEAGRATVKEANLKKSIGLFGVFSIAAGAMISSGVFVLPGLAHAAAGPGVIASYLLAGVFAATGMLSVAEIVTAMPKAGGDYFFITRTMGPAVGTVAGLLTWFALALKTSFALVGLTAFAMPLFGPSWAVDPRLVGMAACLVFLGLNLVGTREAGGVQNLLVIGLLAAMCWYVFAGLPHVQAQRLVPLAPHGWHAVFSVAGLVFVSYGGLLAIASVAEEVRDPGRDIPLGMFMALIVVAIAYTLVVFVTSGVLDDEVLDMSLTPISDGAAVFMGRPGVMVMSAAAILAFVSTANAGLMAASRYLFALSRDDYLPHGLRSLNARFGTPHNALFLTTLLIAGSLFLELTVLVQAASTVFILTYILSNLCLIVLRESRLPTYRPLFVAPFYPWVQIAGIGGALILLTEMGAGALLTSAALTGAGLFFYWFYGRIRSHREFALLHLVERVSRREISAGHLENELGEILRERDVTSMDRFDHLVERALVLDVTGGMDTDELFAFVAERVEKTHGVSRHEVLRQLTACCDDGIDVIVPEVAVAHVDVSGREGFLEMVAVRNVDGVRFEGGRVTAFFLVLSSEGERRFYIQAVAALAQIIADVEFEGKWRRAKNETSLRHLLLIGERRRLLE